MNPERWRQIDDLFQATLACPPDERETFLNRACGADEDLRREVDALLAADQGAESLLEQPAYAIAAPLLVKPNSKELLGKTLGHYRVISLLGSGGMGEVYRARDLKLDRFVALKFLSDDVSTDPDRLRRFIREAKAASALNHPHVATIYEIGEVEEGAPRQNFIAMEFVEGQSLAAKINGQPLALKEIVEISHQIADALSEAHRLGITHRDIKPANVMLNERGQVKVLDFGLAKIAQPSSLSVANDISTQAMTSPGVVMGTVPYMSPEQALGKDVDQRSDLFSLGVVIYEMATGRLPFAGANTIETLDRLLHDEPVAIARLNDKIPAQLESIVSKCLEKNLEQRYQSAAELLADLAELKQDLASGSVRPVARTTVKTKSIRVARFWPLPRRWVWMVLCLGLLLAPSFALYKFATRTHPPSSIAVLPLKNLSGQPDLEWFSDGVTESLITEFQKIKALSVIASTSVMQLKDSKKPVAELARELNVEVILEGSTLRVGDNVRITTHLLEPATSRLLWARNFDAEYKDVLAFYREVARTVANEIQIRLSPEELLKLAQLPAVSPAVQDALLKGRSALNQGWQNPANFQQARNLFEEAVRLEPRNAEALAGLAESTALLGNWGMLGQGTAMTKARDLALQALDIDKDNAAAHRALIFWHFTWQHDWPLAEREIKAALEIAPNDTTALTYYAEWLTLMGRDDEAADTARRYHELAPLDLNLSVQFARICYFARHYDEAIRVSNAILAKDEKNANAMVGLSLTYLALKKEEEAWQWRSKAINNIPLYSPEQRRQFEAAWQAGRWPAVWREELAWCERSKALLQSNYAGQKAFIYSLLGERDNAFAALTVAEQEHSAWLFQLSNPGWDAIRPDPRFNELRKRLHLPPE